MTGQSPTSDRGQERLRRRPPINGEQVRRLKRSLTWTEKNRRDFGLGFSVNGPGGGGAGACSHVDGERWVMAVPESWQDVHDAAISGLLLRWYHRQQHLDLRTGRVLISPFGSNRNRKRTPFVRMVDSKKRHTAMTAVDMHLDKRAFALCLRCTQLQADWVS